MKTTKIQDFVLPIAQRLQSVMEAKGWTPDELAHKARLHPSTVRQVLSGKVYRLAAVSNALGAVDPYALPLVHPVIPPSGGWMATSPPGTQKARESAVQLDADAWIADPMDVALHQGAEPTDEGTDLTPNLDKRLAELKGQGITPQQRAQRVMDGLEDRAGREYLAAAVASLNDEVLRIKDVLLLVPGRDRVQRLEDRITALDEHLAPLTMDVALMKVSDRQTAIQVVADYLVTTTLSEVATHAQVAEVIAALREEINGLIKAIGTDVGRLKGLVHLCQSADIEHSDDIEALKSRMGMMSS
jgi:transcriptional regulator with XRE-family HTH domain